MAELILHIGLPKCGSTTLQRYFSDMDGYLGRGSQDKKANELCTELLRCSHANRFSRVSVKKLVSWGGMVEKYRVSKNIEKQRFILSSEVLSKTKKDYSELFDFLEVLKKNGSFENLKVLVTLREQSTKLASGYAQSSSKRFNASQSDFEKYLKVEMEKNHLDYVDLVLGLHSQLGKNNVKVTFLEEIGTPDFWKEIEEFCHISRSEAGLSNFSSNQANKKSLGMSSWAIQKPCSDIVSRGAAISILTWFWPVSFLKSWRPFARSFLASSHSLVCSCVFSIERRREEKIVLNDDVKASIQQRYASGNRKLEKLIGKKIDHLGY